MHVLPGGAASLPCACARSAMLSRWFVVARIVAEFSRDARVGPGFPGSRTEFEELRGQQFWKRPPAVNKVGRPAGDLRPSTKRTESMARTVADQFADILVAAGVKR